MSKKRRKLPGTVVFAMPESAFHIACKRSS